MSHAPVLSVSRQGVRRFLLDVQDLDADHHYAAGTPATPARVLRQICALEAVQLDPVAAVERNQHLVLAARVPGYTPPVLERLLAQRRVFEYWGHAACVFPIDDYPIFQGKRRGVQARLQPELRSLRAVVRAVLTRLEREGPLPARAFTAGHRVRGWWDNTGPKTKATSHALNILFDAGLVMVARREGLERHFDLPERIVPADLLRRARETDVRDADTALLAKYMRAHRVFDLGDWAFGWRKVPAPRRRAIVERLIRAGEVAALEIEGTRRPYFVLAQDVDRLRRHDRAARDRVAEDGPIRFLAPLDNLLWRRERVADFFGFDYTWEVYVPARRRRYGYYTMPILAGERLVGRIDPRLDRERGRLVVNLLRFEPGIRAPAALRKQVLSALEAFARFHDARSVIIR